MEEISFSKLSWQRIRLSLAMALANGKAIKIKDGYSFLENNIDLKPLYEFLKKIIFETGCGFLVDDGDDINFLPDTLQAGILNISTDKNVPIAEIHLFLMPALFNQDFRTEINYKGVTHSHLSYPTSFLKETLLALIERLGLFASFNLKRFGFYGSGGGLASAKIYPAEIRACDEIISFSNKEIKGAKIFMANMNMDMAHKEKEFLMRNLQIDESKIQIMEILDADGMGNSIQLFVECSGVNIILSRDLQIYNSAGDIVLEESKYYSSINSLVQETESFIKTSFIPPYIMTELIPYLTISNANIPKNIRDLEEYIILKSLL